MKLNHDCVRAVLLYLEKNLELNSSIYSADIKIKKFSNDDIQYSVQKLIEAGFVNFLDTRTLDHYYYSITSISFYGHEYLDNIRDAKTWSVIKKGLSSVGSASLSVVVDFAAKVASDLLFRSIS